jgi:copper chaperone CopZ
MCKLLVKEGGSRKKEILPVIGMDCYGCTKIIKNAVKKIDGVDNVEVNYMLGTVEVTFDPTKTSIKEIEGSIEKAGYRLANKTYETISNKFKKFIYNKDK